MTTHERTEKVERMIKGMMSDAQGCDDFETMDSISRTSYAALELLFDLRAELEPEVDDERSAV